MPHIPKKSPKKLQRSPLNTTDQTPPNTSTNSPYLVEQLDAITKQFNECTASYVEYCESKSTGQATVDDNFEKHKKKVEMFTEYLKNLKPPPLDTPPLAEPKNETIKQISKKSKNIINNLQTKENASQNKSYMAANSTEASLEVKVDEKESNCACADTEESTFATPTQNLKKTGAKAKSNSTHKLDPKPKLNKSNFTVTIENNRIKYTFETEGVSGLSASDANLEQCAKSESVQAKLDLILKEYGSSFAAINSICTCPPNGRLPCSSFPQTLEKSGAKPKSTKTKAGSKPNQTKNSCKVAVDTRGDTRISVPAPSLEKTVAKDQPNKCTSNSKSNHTKASRKVAVDNNLACSSAGYSRISVAPPSLGKTSAEDKSTRTKADSKSNQAKASRKVAVDNNNLACSSAEYSRIAVLPPNLEKTGAEDKPNKTKADLKSNQAKTSCKVAVDKNNLACSPAGYSRISVLPPNLEKTGAEDQPSRTKADLKSNQAKASRKVAVDNNNLACLPAGNSRASAPTSSLEKLGAEDQPTKTKADTQSNQARASREVAVDNNNLTCLPTGDSTSSVPTTSLEKTGAEYQPTKTKENSKSNKIKDSCKVVDNNILACSPTGDTRISVLTPSLEETGAEDQSTKTKADSKSNQARASPEVAVDNNNLCVPTLSDQPTKTKEDSKSNQIKDSYKVVDNNILACSPTGDTKISVLTPSFEETGAEDQSTKTKADSKSNQARASPEVAVDNNNLCVPTLSLEKTGEDQPTKTKEDSKSNQIKDSCKVVANILACPPTGDTRISVLTPSLEKTGAEDQSTKTKADSKSNQARSSPEVAVDNNNLFVDNNILACPPTGDTRISVLTPSFEETCAEDQSTKTKTDWKSNQPQPSRKVAVDNNNLVDSPVRYSKMSAPTPSLEKSGHEFKPTRAEGMVIKRCRSPFPYKADSRRWSFRKHFQTITFVSKRAKTIVELKPNRNREVAVDKSKPSCFSAGDSRLSASKNVGKNGAKSKVTNSKVNMKINGCRSSFMVDVDSRNSSCALSPGRDSTCYLYPPTSGSIDLLELARSVATNAWCSSAPDLNLENYGDEFNYQHTIANLEANQKNISSDVTVDKNKSVCPFTGNLKDKYPNNGKVAVGDNVNQAIPTPESVEETDPKLNLVLKPPSDLSQIIDEFDKTTHHSVTKEQIKLDSNSNKTDDNQPLSPTTCPVPNHTNTNLNKFLPAIAADPNQPVFSPKLTKTKQDSNKANVDGNKPIRPLTHFPNSLATEVESKTTQTESDSESSSEELIGINSDQTSMDVELKEKYPIRPPTPGANVKRAVAKPKATSTCNAQPRQRRVKTKHLTRREVRKLELLNHSRNCSHCSRIHPLDPDDYDKERNTSVQTDILDIDHNKEENVAVETDILDVEVSGTSGSKLEFPYLDQHLEECKHKMENNENQIDKSDVDIMDKLDSEADMNKSVLSNESCVEVRDGDEDDDDTLSCGNSEVGKDILDNDDDVTITAQNVEENCDDDDDDVTITGQNVEEDYVDVEADMEQLEPEISKPNESENPEPTLTTSLLCCKHTKHATDIPEWIDYCPFCDHDSPEHAGTVIPDFCKIRHDQTTCDYTPTQLVKKKVIKKCQQPSVNKVEKQKTSPNNRKNNRKVKLANKKKGGNTGTIQTSNVQMLANVLDINLTHDGKKENRYVKKSWLLPRPSLAMDITPDEVEKQIKSLRKSPIFIEDWEEVYCGRVSQQFPQKNKGMKRKLYSMSSWIESQDYYKLCKPDF